MNKLSIKNKEMEKNWKKQSEKLNTFFAENKRIDSKQVTSHSTCGCSVFTHCSFDNKKSKHDYCRGEDSMKIFL